METYISSTSTANNVDADTFEDACDFGQCCMDPCYYFYVKSKKLWNRCRQPQPKQATAEQSNKDDKAAVLFALQQATYYVIMTGGWTIIFGRGFPLLHASENISNWHGNAAVLVFGSCIISWLLAKFTSPGTITKETLRKYDNYRYDGVLYQHPHDNNNNNNNNNNNICTSSTHHIRKLARSKYDRYSQQQVPRFDHYCGWLGNSIGEENYRYFLLFVAVHTFMACYGAIMTCALMKDAAEDSLKLAMHHGTMAATTTTTTTTASWYNVFLTALRIDAWISLVIILMVFSLPLFVTFLGFHILLVWRNLTTNEYFKWKALGAAGTETKDLELLASHHHTSSRNPCPIYFLRLGSVHQAQSQFYNLGLAANIHEVISPRSLRDSVKTM